MYNQIINFKSKIPIDSLVKKKLSHSRTVCNFIHLRLE